MPLPVAVCVLLVVLAAVGGPVRRRHASGQPVPDLAEPPCATRPGPSGEELLATSVAWIDGVTITEVVAVDDDLVVAFAGGPGAWFMPGDERADALGFVRAGWLEATLPLHLPWPVARRRALGTLSLWRATGQEVKACISVHHGLVGLVGPDGGTVFAAPLSSLLVPVT